MNKSRKKPQTLIEILAINFFHRWKMCLKGLSINVIINYLPNIQQAQLNFHLQNKSNRVFIVRGEFMFLTSKSRI